MLNIFILSNDSIIFRHHWEFIITKAWKQKRYPSICEWIMVHPSNVMLLSKKENSYQDTAKTWVNKSEMCIAK